MKRQTQPQRKKKSRHDHHRTPPGSPPGTLMVDPDAPRPRIRVMAYGPELCTERDVERVDDVAVGSDGAAVTWVNVTGLGDASVIQKIGDLFAIHHLALEDVVHVHQRAKVEPYQDFVFIVARMLRIDGHIESEQFSMFLGDGFVLTFQERHGDVFDRVRDRIRQGLGRIRRAGADFLAYAVLDALIDAYFPVLEVYGEVLDRLEDELVDDGGHDMTKRIHEVKQDLQTMRRAAFPLRDAMSALLRDDARFGEDTRIYLRDCYDHTVQILDLVETYRELGSTLMDVYMSVVSNRMNETMKVLTVIATIFIPLTFIAGVYGMNFDPAVSPWNMPELKWAYGYPMALSIMTIVTVALLLWFRRKRWL